MEVRPNVGTGVDEVLIAERVSPELRCEGKLTVPCRDGGHDVRESLGGLPVDASEGFAETAATARGEDGIFVGSSKSLIAA